MWGLWESVEEGRRPWESSALQALLIGLAGTLQSNRESLEDSVEET